MCNDSLYKAGCLCFPGLSTLKRSETLVNYATNHMDIETKPDDLRKANFEFFKLLKSRVAAIRDKQIDVPLTDTEVVITALVEKQQSFIRFYMLPNTF